jgi:hypothetical protein
LILLVLVAFLAVAVAAPAAQAKTTINCANKAGTRYKPKQAPVKCVHFGPHGISAGGVFLQDLVWSGFGDPTATATGTECGFHLPCAQIPVNVTAYRLKKRCGNRAYTRLRATSTFGTTTVRIKACPGPVPF